MQKCKNIVEFIQELYQTKELIPLHEPRFLGNEKKYLNEVIDSTFISSVGKFVNQFENMVAEFVGSKYAVATSNGTSALHVALKLAGVDENSEVITQPLTFVATANAISYCGAKPIFVDVDIDTMGLSATKLKEFLEEFSTKDENGFCINKTTKKIIKACVPMHTFGHPCKIDEIVEICDEYNIIVVEDAAESLGSYYKGHHCGTFGKLGVFSFNGNKIITCGGGGMIVTDDEVLAKRAKHITTTAKVPHPYEYIHDEIAYNYRLTNLAAAVGVAQMQNLEIYIKKQRELAARYQSFFQNDDVEFVVEPKNSTSNYWLNAIVFQNKDERDIFLKYTNDNNVMTRPIWRLMSRLEIYKDAQCGDLSNSLWLEERVVNISSSIIIK
ncbi:MAG: aminotransferase DegT [Sulfurimonas sp. RIFOXYD12_FULL_33_39]|uniref:LegC family aminotransferase n=1 Tax=unclassified Sulfurimonas TaxID=2623549 RepID=UPI0008AB4E91|nr:MULTISPECIES: LegC family aminotransferase [unclassified Sulfurimonas]OHE10614.1 MAG: aminotransferase DegT [Sulfurimonas sp. RIFOXYD12_FULL_33_39]OHE13144.1 MAG: aminotransferase DegT [Sulfurimonas sp. RIFOXYD2_FULL_34_21]DAB27739.1 MAG TPA: aminotransferase DegT [Sulfurimonas sp. UBA10385]DAB28574.1 MAG TPA: aminotransferase DegT [Sulfurimonas sp. UBA10385]